MRNALTRFIAATLSFTLLANTSGAEGWSRAQPHISNTPLFCFANQAFSPRPVYINGPGSVQHVVQNELALKIIEQTRLVSGAAQSSNGKSNISDLFIEMVGPLFLGASPEDRQAVIASLSQIGDSGFGTTILGPLIQPYERRLADFKRNNETEDIEFLSRSYASAVLPSTLGTIIQNFLNDLSALNDVKTTPAPSVISETPSFPAPAVVPQPISQKADFSNRTKIRVYRGVIVALLLGVIIPFAVLLTPHKGKIALPQKKDSQSSSQPASDPPQPARPAVVAPAVPQAPPAPEKKQTPTKTMQPESASRMSVPAPVPASPIRTVAIDAGALGNAMGALAGVHSQDADIQQALDLLSNQLDLARKGMSRQGSINFQELAKMKESVRKLTDMTGSSDKSISRALSVVSAALDSAQDVAATSKGKGLAAVLFPFFWLAGWIRTRRNQPIVSSLFAREPAFAGVGSPMTRTEQSNFSTVLESIGKTAPVAKAAVKNLFWIIPLVFALGSYLMGGVVDVPIYNQVFSAFQSFVHLLVAHGQVPIIHSVAIVGQGALDMAIKVPFIGMVGALVVFGMVRWALDVIWISIATPLARHRGWPLLQGRVTWLSNSVEILDVLESHYPAFTHPQTAAQLETLRETLANRGMLDTPMMYDLYRTLQQAERAELARQKLLERSQQGETSETVTLTGLLRHWSLHQVQEIPMIFYNFLQLNVLVDGFRRDHGFNRTFRTELDDEAAGRLVRQVKAQWLEGDTATPLAAANPISRLQAGLARSVRSRSLTATPEKLVHHFWSEIFIFRWAQGLLRKRSMMFAIGWMGGGLLQRALTAQTLNSPFFGLLAIVLLINLLTYWIQGARRYRQANPSVGWGSALRAGIRNFYDADSQSTGLTRKKWKAIRVTAVVVAAILLWVAMSLWAPDLNVIHLGSWTLPLQIRSALAPVLTSVGLSLTGVFSGASQKDWLKKRNADLDDWAQALSPEFLHDPRAQVLIEQLSVTYGKRDATQLQRMFGESKIIPGFTVENVRAVMDQMAVLQTSEAAIPLISFLLQDIADGRLPHGTPQAQAEALAVDLLERLEGAPREAALQLIADRRDVEGRLRGAGRSFGLGLVALGDPETLRMFALSAKSMYKLTPLEIWPLLWLGKEGDAHVSAHLIVGQVDAFEGDMIIHAAHFVDSHPGIPAEAIAADLHDYVQAHGLSAHKAEILSDAFLHAIQNGKENWQGIDAMQTAARQATVMTDLLLIPEEQVLGLGDRTGKIFGAVYHGHYKTHDEQESERLASREHFLNQTRGTKEEKHPSLPAWAKFSEKFSTTIDKWLGDWNLVNPGTHVEAASPKPASGAGGSGGGGPPAGGGSGGDDKGRLLHPVMAVAAMAPIVKTVPAKTPDDTPMNPIEKNVSDLETSDTRALVADVVVSAAKAAVAPLDAVSVASRADAVPEESGAVAANDVLGKIDQQQNDVAALKESYEKSSKGHPLPFTVGIYPKIIEVGPFVTGNKEDFIRIFGEVKIPLPGRPLRHHEARKSLLDGETKTEKSLASTEETRQPIVEQMMAVNRLQAIKTLADESSRLAAQVRDHAQQQRQANRMSGWDAANADTVADKERDASQIEAEKQATLLEFARLSGLPADKLPPGILTKDGLDRQVLMKYLTGQLSQANETADKPADTKKGNTSKDKKVPPEKTAPKAYDPKAQETVLALAGALDRAEMLVEGNIRKMGKWNPLPAHLIVRVAPSISRPSLSHLLAKYSSFGTVNWDYDPIEKLDWEKEPGKMKDAIDAFNLGRGDTFRSAVRSAHDLLHARDAVTIAQGRLEAAREAIASETRAATSQVQDLENFDGAARDLVQAQQDMLSAELSLMKSGFEDTDIESVLMFDLTDSSIDVQVDRVSAIAVTRFFKEIADQLMPNDEKSQKKLNEDLKKAATQSAHREPYVKLKKEIDAFDQDAAWAKKPSLERYSELLSKIEQFDKNIKHSSKHPYGDLLSQVNAFDKDFKKTEEAKRTKDPYGDLMGVINHFAPYDDLMQDLRSAASKPLWDEKAEAKNTDPLHEVMAANHSLPDRDKLSTDAPSTFQVTTPKTAGATPNLAFTTSKTQTSIYAFTDLDGRGNKWPSGTANYPVNMTLVLNGKKISSAMHDYKEAYEAAQKQDAISNDKDYDARVADLKLEFASLNMQISYLQKEKALIVDATKVKGADVSTLNQDAASLDQEINRLSGESAQVNLKLRGNAREGSANQAPTYDLSVAEYRLAAAASRLKEADIKQLPIGVTGQYGTTRLVDPHAFIFNPYTIGLNDVLLKPVLKPMVMPLVKGVGALFHHHSTEKSDLDLAQAQLHAEERLKLTKDNYQASSEKLERAKHRVHDAEEVLNEAKASEKTSGDTLETSRAILSAERDMFAATENLIKAQQHFDYWKSSKDQYDQILAAVGPQKPADLKNKPANPDELALTTQLFKLWWGQGASQETLDDREQALAVDVAKDRKGDSHFLNSPSLVASPVVARDTTGDRPINTLFGGGGWSGTLSPSSQAKQEENVVKELKKVFEAQAQKRAEDNAGVIAQPSIASQLAAAQALKDLADQLIAQAASLEKPVGNKPRLPALPGQAAAFAVAEHQLRVRAARMEDEALDAASDLGLSEKQAKDIQPSRALHQITNLDLVFENLKKAKMSAAQKEDSRIHHSPWAAGMKHIPDLSLDFFYINSVMTSGSNRLWSAGGESYTGPSQMRLPPHVAKSKEIKTQITTAEDQSRDESMKRQLRKLSDNIKFEKEATLKAKTALQTALDKHLAFEKDVKRDYIDQTAILDPVRRVAEARLAYETASGKLQKAERALLVYLDIDPVKDAEAKIPGTAIDEEGVPELPTAVSETVIPLSAHDEEIGRYFRPFARAVTRGDSAESGGYADPAVMDRLHSLLDYYHQRPEDWEKLVALAKTVGLDVPRNDTLLSQAQSFDQNLFYAIAIIQGIYHDDPQHRDIPTVLNQALKDGPERVKLLEVLSRVHESLPWGKQLFGEQWRTLQSYYVGWINGLVIENVTDPKNAVWPQVSAVLKILTAPESTNSLQEMAKLFPGKNPFADRVQLVRFLTEQKVREMSHEGKAKLNDDALAAQLTMGRLIIENIAVKMNLLNGNTSPAVRRQLLSLALDSAAQWIPTDKPHDLKRFVTAFDKVSADWGPPIKKGPSQKTRNPVKADPYKLLDGYVGSLAKQAKKEAPHILLAETTVPIPAKPTASHVMTVVSLPPIQISHPVQPFPLSAPSIAAPEKPVVLQTPAQREVPLAELAQKLESDLHTLVAHVDQASASDAMPEGVRRKAYVTRAYIGGDAQAYEMIATLRSDAMDVSNTVEGLEKEIGTRSISAKLDYYHQKMAVEKDLPQAESWLPVQVLEGGTPVVVAETIDPAGWLVSMAYREGIVYESRFHQLADGNVMRSDFIWQWDETKNEFVSVGVQASPRQYGHTNVRYAFDKYGSVVLGVNGELLEKGHTESGAEKEQKWGSQTNLPGSQIDTPKTSPSNESFSKAGLGLLLLPLVLSRLKIRLSRNAGLAAGFLALVLASFTGFGSIFLLTAMGATLTVLFPNGFGHSFAFFPKHNVFQSRTGRAA